MVPINKPLLARDFRPFTRQQTAFSAIALHWLTFSNSLLDSRKLPNRSFSSLSSADSFQLIAFIFLIHSSCFNVSTEIVPNNFWHNRGLCLTNSAIKLNL